MREIKREKERERVGEKERMRKRERERERRSNLFFSCLFGASNMGTE
jgi:hypothetical protein